jgi:hypothetical protein
MKAKQQAPAKIADMAPITRKIDALLRAEGFSNTSNSRIVGGNDNLINDLGYTRHNAERVFIIVHEAAPEIGAALQGR